MKPAQPRIKSLPPLCLYLTDSFLTLARSLTQCEPGFFTGLRKIGAILTVLSILSVVARIVLVEQNQE